ncbi:nucleoside triphosphate pyrophosphohydrolase [Neobacillus sp. 179-C4.2 HS]|uniref:Nucleoside triphosphate pyrophosphohydrolase n=1 Tax=Neobacillus driksii TaxID=3035913 RepID=A0ABV4YV74_9BACI|nr:nucleoside triphosphate pyrophosphohydrolase [Neobacillus sp. 179.-C4.2 HS]MDP5192766.1 nucleoside triphosphate pyrophosphohydrolase [Neobacillus sp. 179.-C4.2 HS]
MIVYNKLIRDKIPKIIEQSGKQAVIETLDDSRYEITLKEKLQEELKEFYEDDSLTELADLVEVIHAIVLHKGCSIERFENIRMEKREKRGGFDEKLFLVSVDE